MKVSVRVFRPRTKSRPKSAEVNSRKLSELDRAGFFQRFVSAVLIDRLQSAGGHADAHELLQFRHPDAMFVQVRYEPARHIFGYMPANAAFFLGHTAAANGTAAYGFRTGNVTNFRHGA